MTEIALLQIPDGIAGIRETLKVARRMVRQSVRSDPRVRDCASDLVREVPGKCFNQEVSAVYYYIRDFIRYQKDILNIETLQTPGETLARGYGDCDDHAILICALLHSIGHLTRFMAIGLTPDSLVHVYAQVCLGNPNDKRAWLSLDTTEKQCPGWEPPGIRNRLSISNGN